MGILRGGSKKKAASTIIIALLLLVLVVSAGALLYGMRGSSKMYTLTTHTTGSGTGSVILDPSGGSYISGTLVTVTAFTSSGSFTGWSGSLSGTMNPSTITMNENKDLTATYTGFGSIQVTKNTVPDDKMVFTFTGSGSIGGFNLYDNGTQHDSQSFSNLAIDTYKITEKVPPGWILKEIQISGDADGGSTINLPTIAVDLDVGENITVTFINKKLPNNFSIIVLPDTQYYSELYPKIFSNQTSWIVDNVEALNIMYVTHEGDIVDWFFFPEQWQNAFDSMSKLDGKVAWGVLPGNHDGFRVGEASENLADYASYFGDANSFELFSGGGDDYLIFHLQYNADSSVLAWANTTIVNYPNRRVIVVTHDYLVASGRRSTIGNRIWKSFVSPHADQVFLVLCGHNSGEAFRSDTVRGYTVYQVMADYQSRSNGGDGWLRILDFNPVEDLIYVNTYSPHLNQYETDSNSQFTLSYDMTETSP